MAKQITTFVTKATDDLKHGRESWRAMSVLCTIALAVSLAFGVARF